MSLSPRRARFYSLVRSADKESSSFLAQILDRYRASPALQRLAILRVLVCRNYGLTTDTGGIGWPYPQRKRRVRQILGI